MKRGLFLALLLLFIVSKTAYADTEIDRRMAQYDYDIEVSGTAVTDADGSFEDNTRRIASGEKVLSFQGVYDTSLGLIRREGGGALALLLEIVAVSVLFAVLTNMQSSFNAESVKNTVFFVCYLVIAALVIDAFEQAVIAFKSAVGSAVVFINGSVPILTGLLVSSGKTATAAGINPVILTGCAILSNAIQFLLVPVLYSIAALTMVGNISSTVSVGGLAAFLKKTVRWGLCFLLTAFSGVLAVQGFGASAMDAAAAKTARFVVSNGVPIVGSVLSDTVETVAGCSVLIKNATGAAGIIALFTICLAPVIKIGLTSLLFHLAAAVIEPVTDKRIYQAVNGTAEVLSLMVGVLCAIFVMFIICISMLMCVGN